MVCISVLISTRWLCNSRRLADAMTVEAVPTVNHEGQPYSKEETKLMYTTMQTLGRFAIIGGTSQLLRTLLSLAIPKG